MYNLLSEIPNLIRRNRNFRRGAQHQQRLHAFIQPAGDVERRAFTVTRMNCV
jgi:hypothetical protein